MWGPDSPERQALLWPCPVIEEKIRTEIICLFLTTILIFCALLQRTRRPQKGAENLPYWDRKLGSTSSTETWNSKMNSIWQSQRSKVCKNVRTSHSESTGYRRTLIRNEWDGSMCFFFTQKKSFSQRIFTTCLFVFTQPYEHCRTFIHHLKKVKNLHFIAKFWT